jgi:ribonucleoside-triphosphate reductase
MVIIKRDGTKEEFNADKIFNALTKAFKACGYTSVENVIRDMVSEMRFWDNITVEEIQDEVEETLYNYEYFDVARAYSIYREEHKKARFIRSRLNYMDTYKDSGVNASTSSETDANANVASKNVANLEGEVYKVTNRIIQRQRMKDKLNKLYPGQELGRQYIKDLENHIIYTHDEASTPVLKPYCKAVTLYPLMLEGVGNIDGVTPSAPNDIQSFSGQVTNAVFLFSSQCKGAVALGDYFIALNYYVIQEFGPVWYDKVDEVVTNSHFLHQYTVGHYIRKGMKQFIYGVNQPAGNRSYNSPFSNVSFYDKVYFKSLFGEFYYPDGTQPEWNAIDKLQRIFMQLLREIRLIKPLTFPVTTMALVHNNKEYLDPEYKELCAEEWAKGGSFFCYTSDNPTSLASCCRVLNEMSDNTFSSTTGMTGVMTGSCNVITLNINRIVQDYIHTWKNWEDHIVDGKCAFPFEWFSENFSDLKNYLINILERVYKYHIAYKTMLYEMEDAKMFSDCNAGYIYMRKLYSTIGLIGYCEAAQFLGLSVSNNEAYKDFLKLVFGTVKEENKKNSIHDSKRPFLFNSEAIPGEGLGVKLYNWDKKDGYTVPENQNLYNCYFYNPWDETSILDKFKLHGRGVAQYCDGGQALHANLDAHLSKQQYLHLLDVAKDEGTSYFTFNIPMSQCRECGHVVNAPIDECPICHCRHIKYYTRIIGYLVCVDNWSNPRQLEFAIRKYKSGDRSFTYKPNL